MPPADPRLQTRVGALPLRTPVLAASGTFGNGLEYADFLDLAALGGLVTKSVTAEPTAGNPPPRVTETPAGMLNAIGLQNEGVERFCGEILPPLAAALRGAPPAAPAAGPPARLVVNVAGKRPEDYAAVVDRLAGEEAIDALEINVSCPNVREGGMAFGVCAESCEGLIADLRRRTAQPLWVKLSPNVTDITEPARAAEAAGADALVVANTLLGLVVDVETRRPVLGNGTGGLSGPAVRPVALRLVRQVHEAVQVPIIGVGGVASAEDAVAFLLCGASAVEVGTMNFVEPAICQRLAADLEAWLFTHNETAEGLVGALESEPPA
jgi:dihydroorotate dehydrogenase (NAD+) catalytic subunit